MNKEIVNYSGRIDVWDWSELPAVDFGEMYLRVARIAILVCGNQIEMVEGKGAGVALNALRLRGDLQEGRKVRRGWGRKASPVARGRMIHLSSMTTQKFQAEKVKSNVREKWMDDRTMMILFALSSAIATASIRQNIRRLEPQQPKQSQRCRDALRQIHKV